MRIVLIGHTRHPLAEPFAGGLESLTWHLARGLVERGHHAAVFAARGSSIPGVEHLWPEELDLSPAAQADVSMPERGWMDRHHAYLALMMELAGRTDLDIVHNHALHYLPAAMSPLLQARTVLTLHTPPTPWLESALQVAQRTPGPQPVVTAVSRHTAKGWSHLVAPTVIPNGVDTAAWRPGPGGDALVWSGRIVPEKAPHLAARIARESGMPLVLAGPRSDEDYFHAKVAPLLGGDVTYAGHLRTSDLAGLVGSSAAALVTPAWEEPYGLVAAEALSCGTPVLGLARGGLTEVVDPRVGRLLPATDTATGRPLPEDEVVRRAVLELPAVLATDRAAVRAHAERHLSLDRMVEDYLRLYTALLPGEPALGVAS